MPRDEPLSDSPPVELRRRTFEERLDWLTMEVGVLRAEVNQLKREKADG